MTPRLTKSERAARPWKLPHRIGSTKPIVGSRPSPAERLRQRRKARAAVLRSIKIQEDADLHVAYLMGRGDRVLPEFR